MSMLVETRTIGDARAGARSPVERAVETIGDSRNAMSIDVEDYFQVEAFRSVIRREYWDQYPRRVERNTQLVLELLEAAKVRATFFVLGWVAERHSGLVRDIAAGGHEVASHGYGHERVDRQPASEFAADVRRARHILEDATGLAVRGYRAPTFSLRPENDRAYGILAETGYVYSSSVCPIAHDLYGAPNAPRTPFCPLPGSTFLEIPVATVRLFGANRPCAGGGWFRLMPYRATRWALRHAMETERLRCVFYCHPWEFDPEQPRMRSAPLKSRLRHCVNLGATRGRFERLLADFVWGRMDEIFLREQVGELATPD